MSTIAILKSQNTYKISPQFISGSNIACNDLLRTLIVFNGPESISAIPSAEIFDEGGNKIIELHGVFIELTYGVQIKQIELDRVVYYSASIEEYENYFNSLPPGNYMICYKLNCVNPDCDGKGSQLLFTENANCTSFQVGPITPLRLSYPPDLSMVNNPRPIHSWVPPMPLSQIEGFSYRISIYTPQKGQSCIDAVINNPPIYQEFELLENTINYPIELENIDTGEIHCWNVTGILMGKPVVQSETWQYSLVKDSLIKKIPSEQSYIELDKQDARILIKTGRMIKLKYASRNTNLSLKCSISRVNKSKQKKELILEKTLEVKNVENYFKIDLSEYQSLNEGDLLEVIVKGPKGNYTLNYQIINK